VAELSNKERMKIPRQPMPTQDPRVRRTNFSEVALGFDEEAMLREANRCIQCKKAPCVQGCPVEVPIPEFIAAMREGDMPQAVTIMKGKNNLPAICGRVCPQETQCEVVCTLGKKGDPVAIGRLERYLGDWELAERACPLIASDPTSARSMMIRSGSDC